MKVLTLVCAILFAGVTANPTVVNLDAGHDYAFTILAIGQEIAKCVLKTPAGATLEFEPGYSSQHGDRFELQPISSLPACSIHVSDLQTSDSGVWEVSYVNTAGTGNSQSYQLNVVSDDSGNSAGAEDPVNSEVSAIPTLVNLDAGKDYAFTILAIGQEIAKCVLKTPAGATLEFEPGYSSQHGDRFELQPISSLPACSIHVSDLQTSDSGVWEVSYMNTAGTGDSQSYQLIVVGDDSGNSAGVEDPVNSEVSAIPTLVNLDAGKDYAFTILAIGQEIAKCVLKTPAGASLEFEPGYSSQHGDRFELQPISSLPACSIHVSDLQTSESGVWEVSYVNTAGTGNSQSYQLNVVSDDSGNSTGGEDSDNSDTITPENEHDEPTQTTTPENNIIDWLDIIQFPTRTSQVVDISLPRIQQQEECSIHTPDGKNMNLLDVKIEGVNVHTSSNSYFVSCRITIGPMSEELLGDWAICGKHTENSEVHERCQPARIYWNSENNPGAQWHIDLREKFNHPVHLDSYLSPVVTGIGEVVACHIITNAMEDLHITPDSQYPAIRVTMPTSACRFDIGPISTRLLGDWIIYGLFTNSVEGLHEVRFPFSMSIYDEDNPFHQAYNTSVLDPVTRAINMGNTLNIQVAGAGKVEGCYIRTPNNELLSMASEYNFDGASFINEADGNIACTVALGPMTISLLGDWTLIGKFRNNDIYTKIEHTFHIVEEDPENPIQDDRTIYYLTAQSVKTEKGLSNTFVIPTQDFIYGDSCHIRTPSGLQYELMEGFNRVPGVEFIQDSNVECGVIITVLSEDEVGEWTLIARVRHHSEPVERRLPVTIYVEESVRALQDTITLAEGDDLYVSLQYPTEHYETCRLIGPYGFECQAAVRNPDKMETCGFIRKNAQTFNTGTWTITYGDKIVYNAKIAVTVTDPENILTPGVTTTTVSLVRDRSVAQSVGPEDSTYCRLEDPQGVVVFDSFGRCQLNLVSVGLEHQGTWKMLVAAAGRVLAEQHSLIVNVVESEGKPVVSAYVSEEKPIVNIACSVHPASAVTGCKFRDPHGNILIAASGLSEGRYSFYGKGASTESSVLTHECGISITEPSTSDLGLWRCAIETLSETYYGHLPLLSLEALQDPAVAAVVQQEPILKASRSLVTVVEEEPTVLSCSVEAAIRYCYFRSSNGTTFAVSPGMSSPGMEYVGAGFDAGECGVKFLSLHAADSGRWSCHVGLIRDYDEQSDQVQLTVQERMRVNHYTSHGNAMTVEGIVYEGRALDYCRFVRIDGLGFTNENMPSQYTFSGILANGECQFTAREPTMLDLHPWTVAAKIRGQDAEMSKDTMEYVLVGGQAPEDNRPDVIYFRSNGLFIFMYVFMSLLLLSIVMGGLFGPKRNREWTAQRASAFRRSISNSFRKQPQTNDSAPQYTP